CGQGTHIPWTF
nr:immunoglobulin light chain junction region [Macaca mulatta]MOV79932.1 immunoglobulin light chain junction region [Macaca mulatta]